MADNSTRCQSIYRNLLQSWNITAHQNPTVFIRELAETSRCDQFYDLSVVRGAYHAKLGKESMHRIAIFKQTDEDVERAEQTVVHYYDWTHKQLLRALDWQGLLWYNTLYKWDRTVALLTLGGGVIGGWRFVKPWTKKGQVPPPQ